MQKIDAKPFVITITVFADIFYLICALLVLLMPELFLKLASQWAHAIDLTKIAVTPVLSDIVFGFITMTITIVILSLLFVFLWNTFNKTQWR